MASLSPSLHLPCNSRTGFLGKSQGIRLRVIPAGRVGFVRKTVECKESRIGKKPIEVPSNVTLTLEEQFVKAKGPLGELSLNYPTEVKVVKEETGKLRVFKTVETKRANQMHGLFSSDKHCPKLMEFIRSGIYIASVDITNDKIKMRSTWGIEIPAECHIDLQDRFRLEHDKTSMADMAALLIDEEYADMKRKFPQSGHKHWEKTPLDPINIEYAAIDGYVAYELYRRIGISNYGQRHLVPVVPPAYGYSDSDDEYSDSDDGYSDSDDE